MARCLKGSLLCLHRHSRYSYKHYCSRSAAHAATLEATMSPDSLTCRCHVDAFAVAMRSSLTQFAMFSVDPQTLHHYCHDDRVFLNLQYGRLQVG